MNFIILASVSHQCVAAVKTSEMTQSCHSCVKEGCIWCEQSKFHRKGSFCHCEEFGGFWGDCNDLSFGAEKLDSSIDCLFESSDGDIILGVVICVIGIFCCGGGFFCHKYRKRKSAFKSDRTQHMSSVDNVGITTDNPGNNFSSVPLSRISVSSLPFVTAVPTETLPISALKSQNITPLEPMNTAIIVEPTTLPPSVVNSEPSVASNYEVHSVRHYNISDVTESFPVTSVREGSISNARTM